MRKIIIGMMGFEAIWIFLSMYSVQLTQNIESFAECSWGTLSIFALDTIMFFPGILFATYLILYFGTLPIRVILDYTQTRQEKE